MSMNILLADDDPVIRRLFEKRLQDEGYTITLAVDGSDAAMQLDNSHFDVIITDLVMPGDIGGIELLELGKEKDVLTEVIVITAHSSIDTAVDAMKKGAADYLEKPVNFDELFLRLDKIAQLKSLVRNADDLRNAMDITESSAAQTIQNLEIVTAELQAKIDSIEDALTESSHAEYERIDKALQVING